MIRPRGVGELPTNLSRKMEHALIQLIEDGLDGDGASTDEEKEPHFASEKNAHFLLFDLS